MEVHDLVRWANAADAPSDRSIGRNAVARVLVQLAAHATADGDAWPSQRTLADEISGLARRDVQNALELLEQAELIKRNGNVGRATRYRLAISAWTGYPSHVDGRADGRGDGREHGRDTPSRSEGKGRTPRPPADRCSSCGHPIAVDGSCSCSRPASTTDPDESCFTGEARGA